MGKIEAVSFDFWETLFGFLSLQELEEFRRIRAEGFSQVLSIPLREVEKAFQQIIIEMNREREATGLEIPLDEIIRRTVKQLGINEAPLDRLEKIYIKAVFERLPGPLPGALETIQELMKRGIPLAIISNTIHGQIEKAILRHYQLQDNFKILLFSSEVRYRKPRPEIFRMALHHLRAPPEKAMHVGDTPNADVVGALKAGMEAVYYNPQEEDYPPELPQPHYTIRHLTQVLDLVAP
jgi:HAD superfamily hydrolase (TIGR01509 family)